MKKKSTGNSPAKDTKRPRRAFLGRTTALLAGTAGASGLDLLMPRVATAGQPLRRSEAPPWDQAPPFKISLAQWSLHRTLRAGKIDNLDFARVASGFGIDAVEYVNSFFKDKARDKKYLLEMKTRATGEGVWSALIMIDGEGDLGDPDKNKRKQVVENHHRWIDAAFYLGCHSIRVNARSEGDYDEQIKLAADGLRNLCEYADPFGINVIVENHGGLSSNGAWLANVMQTANHPRCGTLPDFGNFRINDGEEYDRYQGVTELMPYARAVSAKSMHFDRKGNETTIDYFRMMKIVLDARYRGYVGIEYEGETLSEFDGIAATKKLLERVAAKLGRKAI